VKGTTSVSIISTIEAKAEQIWAELSGAAKADLEQALADARAEEAKILPLVEAFAKQIGEQVLADVSPEVKTLGEQLLAQLIADLGGVLGTGPEQPTAA
jgi:vacuolar-type H+-ATPase subunit H